MSDYNPNDPLYRNQSDPLYRSPNDPLRRDVADDPAARRTNAAWGWVAGAVFLAIVLAIAFGVGHSPNQPNSTVANNNAPPPAATQPMAPPAGPASRTMAPTNPAQPRP